MRKIKWYGLLLFAGLFIVSCSKTGLSTNSLYVPLSSDATATATFDELTQGRTLYINNCNSCHSLYSPDNFTASGWKTIMTSMGPRTGLSSAQLTLITKYLTRGK